MSLDIADELRGYAPFAHPEEARYRLSQFGRLLEDLGILPTQTQEWLDFEADRLGHFSLDDAVPGVGLCQLNVDSMLLWVKPYVEFRGPDSPDSAPWLKNNWIEASLLFFDESGRELDLLPNRSEVRALWSIVRRMIPDFGSAGIFLDWELASTFDVLFGMEEDELGHKLWTFGMAFVPDHLSDRFALKPSGYFAEAWEGGMAIVDTEFGYLPSDLK